MTIQDTADALYDAVMLDVMPRISACVDFGLDIQPELYSIYQDKVRKGDITLEDLRDSKCEDDKLSVLLGTPVKTIYSQMVSE